MRGRLLCGLILMAVACVSVILLILSYTRQEGISVNCGGSYNENGVVFNRECVFEDAVIKDVNDGFLANIQGHGRKSPGEFAYGKPDVDVNLLGHAIDTSCCYGKGVVIGDEKFTGERKSYGMILRNGSIKSRSGVFLMGHGHFDEFSVIDNGDVCNLIDFTGQSNKIKFLDMSLLGRDGEVLTRDSEISGSIIRMAVIKVQGSNFEFMKNKFLLDMDSGRPLISDHSRRMNLFRSEYIGKYSLIEDLYSVAALYLSCADNATISNNIFTAKTKIPGAYAIVLKHSKNVRITNNTFEGFTVPVLMDKYSSIIDDRGNIIKPDVTINSPQSRLYKVDLDHVQGDTGRPWWQFWQ